MLRVWQSLWSSLDIGTADNHVSGTIIMKTMARIRILVVDDLAGVRQDLRTILELAEDLEVVGEAANGLEAVQLAERLHPDVVLMDLEMPVMDGCEATRQIKDHHLATAVVVLTIHDHSSAGARATEAGADAFVEKATAIGTLIPAIRCVFGNHLQK